MDGTVFAAYLDQVLNPTRRSGNAAVPDNLAVHKLDGLAEVVKNTGHSCRNYRWSRLILN